MTVVAMGVALLVYCGLLFYALLMRTENEEQQQEIALLEDRCRYLESNMPGWKPGVRR